LLFADDIGVVSLDCRFVTCFIPLHLYEYLHIRWNLRKAQGKVARIKVYPKAQLISKGTGLSASQFRIDALLFISPPITMASILSACIRRIEFSGFVHGLTSEVLDDA